ncbi:MAG TPA: hypothetical protein VMD79_08995 [Solirubrobacteraceae bacterium]|nr:hypothetical protein [Solirubrobacteraceae bacterium]
MATRKAMLKGLTANERIIVGAYVDEHGGVCPMLAAHRSGGRTDFLSFAKAWDRFAGARGTARVATAREVRILLTQLEASLTESDGLEFDRAIREHRQLRAKTVRRPRLRLPERVDPEGEIRARRLRPRRQAAPAGRPVRGSEPRLALAGR